MTPISHLYKLGTSCLYLLYPIAKLHCDIFGKNKKSVKQRFGSYPETIVRRNSQIPRIWMHGASVGEISVAYAIFKELENLTSGYEVVISTTTETGNTVAEATFPGNTPIIFAPLDIPKAVAEALSFIKPEVMVFIETELWPNWIRRTHQMGIPTILVNGRISRRSMRRYEKIKVLMKDTLNNFDCLSMIHSDDGQRIQRLGADQKIIKINGNAKFDNLTRPVEDHETKKIRELYSIEDTSVVFVAGSTRQSEGELILRAYQDILKTHPEVQLFIAPRHIERSRDIAGIARSMGLNYQLRTEFDGVRVKRASSVVIIDVIGELSTLYGAGTVCFCGGSLVPLGGQNILEPVSWGKPVFYGPHMDDFQEARELIEDAVGEALLVTDGDMLVQKVVAILDDPDYGKKVGDKARQGVLKNRGAAKKHAQEIVNLLTHKK